MSGRAGPGLPVETYFSPEEVERARAYHGPAYRLAAARAALGFLALGVLGFTRAGDGLWAAVRDAPLAGFLFPWIVVVVTALVRLPLAYLRHRHERRWGFSTQTVRSWAMDVAKSVLISSILTAALLLGLTELAGALPEAWPVVAAPAAAAVLVALSFLGPVVFEPLFNRFRPLEREVLAAELASLSVRAGVPVRRVLVSDASRRTTKHNAYVSGLGASRRVVLFDTLLARGDDRAVELVVAHELGHRRLRHMARGTALAALGAVAAVVVLWVVLDRPADPRSAPVALLAVSVLGLASDPLGKAISRRWEAAADRFAVDLTGDPHGFAEMERSLAVENLSDLAPGRLARLFVLTHPTPPERIRAALARRRGAAPGTDR